MGGGGGGGRTFDIIEISTSDTVTILLQGLASIFTARNPVSSNSWAL